MKRLTSLLMILLFIAGLLAGCGKNQSGADNTTVPGTGDTSGAADTTEYRELPTLSGEKYNGYEFVTLTAFQMKYDDFNGENNLDGYEKVNEAIFLRNSMLEEKYDIKFTGIFESGSSTGNGVGFRRLSEDYIVNDSSYTSAR